MPPPRANSLFGEPEEDQQRFGADLGLLEELNTIGPSRNVPQGEALPDPNQAFLSELNAIGGSQQGIDTPAVTGTDPNQGFLDELNSIGGQSRTAQTIPDDDRGFLGDLAAAGERGS